jgi:tRNA nucleotidyltransferase/poly(A) polymerase
MTYDEFLNFLDQFEEIQSFRQKIIYADQNLLKLGAGSGRIVYDIDGTKVFKLAKNAKGVAQNDAEINIGRYPDTHYIVTKVLESDNNGSWIVAEKAKKVSEARIKQLTGIPSLNELFYFLRNHENRIKGGGNIFGLDVDIEKLLNDNEFVTDLQDIMSNYSISAGDLGRASTYGEVFRDGQPTIVLSDYGLTDEVYNTHYSPKRKQQYQMYEMFNCADGNDDILSDMPPQDAIDTRRGMWAQMPYGVGDGGGVINEGFISFVLARDKYPKKLPSAPYVLDEFHNVVNNLKEVLKRVPQKKKFYNNLLTLQEWLIENKYYDRDPLLKEEYEINEATNPSRQTVKPFTLEDKNYATELASAFAKKINLGAEPVYMDGGSNGHAFTINDNVILKITADKSEADAAGKLINEQPKYIAKIFSFYKIIDTVKQLAFFAILQENVKDKPTAEFFIYMKTIDTIEPAGLNYIDILLMMRKKSSAEVGEVAKHLISDKPELNISAEDRESTYDYLIDLINIQEELRKYGIKSDDYGNAGNLGYQNGVLKFFDVGGYKAHEPTMMAQDIIYLPEDGSAKFSTDNAMGQDNFPAHNNIDNSPSIQNDINANTNIEEDLEYNHVDDATKDEYLMSEEVQNVNKIKLSEVYPEMPDKHEMLWNFITTDEYNNTYFELKKLSVKDIYLFYNNGEIEDSIDNTKEEQLETIKYYEENIEKHLNDYFVISTSDKILIDGYHKIVAFFNKEVATINAVDISSEELNEERKLSSMEGSSTVEIKKKCRLGGLGNTSAQCNWGDINAVDIKPLKEEVNEEVNAKEMRSDIAAIKSILNGKRGVAFLEINKEIAQKLEKRKIGVIPTRMTSRLTMMAIIYTDKVKAYLLYDFAKNNEGYLKDKTPEEAREIGKLLDYKPSDIEQHIRNKYGSKVPIMPDKSPDDFNDLDEEVAYDFWDLNEENFPEFEKDIQQDLTTHHLDKKFIRNYQDGDHTYSVFAVNGDQVRDSGFIEWVDGGNHWVDADLPKIEQKYASHIGENEYWIDDVFMIKPADFEAILLHERTESFIIRHYGYEYDDAHEIANKIEMMFRKNIPNGANRAIAEKIYDTFVKTFKPEKSKQKHEPANESINEVLTEGNIRVPNYDHTGWITPDNKFIESDVHLAYLVRLYPDIKSQNEIYNRAYNDGYTRIIFNKGEIGNILDIHAPTEERLKEVLLDAYSSSLGGESYIYTDIGDEEHSKHQNFQLPTDKEDLDNFLYSNKRMRKMIYEGQIMGLNYLPFREDVEEAGGKIYSVGGAVRDEILGKESKDLDILITGIPFEQLEQILGKYGAVNAVGKSFGVLKFKPKGATEDIDIAIPRTETPTGEGGHQGFDVKSDHALPIEKDLERRDFTINAIAKDIDGNIVDPFGGQEDLKNKVIKVVNPQAFSDDPLRMLRAVQFASRFGFTIEPETMKMIQENAERVKEIAPERILTEFDKIVKKGNILTGAILLDETGLLKEIFGKGLYYDFRNTKEPFDKVRTIGEFVYLLSKNLVNDPAEFYKTNLKGDENAYREIKALQIAFESREATNLVEARSVAHNMYVISPTSLQSQILPNVIKTAAQELLQGKYPKSVNELAINGNDLMQLGLQGKAIGDMQKSLLLKVYSNNAMNNKEDLLSLAKQEKPMIKEEHAEGLGWRKYSNRKLYFGSPSGMMMVVLNNIVFDKETNTYLIEMRPLDNKFRGDIWTTNMTEEQLVEFIDNGRVDYNHPINGSHVRLTTIEKYDALQNARNTVGFANAKEIKEETSERIEYGCLMLFLEVPIWSKITSVVDLDDLYIKGDDYGVEKEPHLTILYGFHDEVTPEQVFELYKSKMPLKPIEVKISGISVFENPDFDVVKFDVNSDLLAKVNGIMRELPNTTKFPDYHAHITIAYVKKGEGKKYIKPFEKERILKGDELVYTWKGRRGKDGEILNLNDDGLLKEFSYDTLEPEKKDIWNINGQEVGIPFFVEKYDIWNQDGYKDPSTASVLEFFQNNYEDLTHDEHLKKELLWALTDRELLNE